MKAPAILETEWLFIDYSIWLGRKGGGGRGGGDESAAISKIVTNGNRLTSLQPTVVSGAVCSTCFVKYNIYQMSVSCQNGQFGQVWSSTVEHAVSELMLTVLASDDLEWILKKPTEWPKKKKKKKKKIKKFLKECFSQTKPEVTAI